MDARDIHRAYMEVQRFLKKTKKPTSTTKRKALSLYHVVILSILGLTLLIVWVYLIAILID